MNPVLPGTELKPKSRLGRGLSSLMAAADLPIHQITGPPALIPPASDKPAALPVDQIAVNPNQPRRAFVGAELATLAESIRVNGVIQPIVVRQTPGGYQLIAGERRLRAAKLAGLTDIPVHIVEVDDWTQSQWALVENIHRSDLNAIERAEAYRNLMQQGGLTQNELAAKLGEDRSVIANHLRLMDLQPQVRQWVQQGDLSLGHAKVLAAIEDGRQQTELAELAVREGWSVRALEASRNGTILPTPAKSGNPKPPKSSAHIADIEKSLSRQLGFKLKIKAVGGRGKGRLIIQFGSLEHFDELMSRLGLTIDE